MIHETIKVYCADSVRKDNGTQAGMPVFGRFAAIVREDSFRLIEDDDSGLWSISLPCGSSRVIGDLLEGETREAWEETKAWLAAGTRNRDGWTIDRDVAKHEATKKALERHNGKAKESVSYARKYGSESPE